MQERCVLYGGVIVIVITPKYKSLGSYWVFSKESAFTTCPRGYVQPTRPLTILLRSPFFSKTMSVASDDSDFKVDNSDDTNSGHGSSANKQEEPADKEQLAHRETLAVFRLRVLVR